MQQTIHGKKHRAERWAKGHHAQKKQRQIGAHLSRPDKQKKEHHREITQQKQQIYFEKIQDFLTGIQNIVNAEYFAQHIALSSFLSRVFVI